MKRDLINSKRTNKKLLIVLVLVILAATLPLSYVSLKVIRYKTYIWMPNYFLRPHSNDIHKITNGHVLFLIADHHEPGHGERGVQRSTTWCEAYKKNIQGIYDDFGNPVQYTDTL